MGTGLLPHVERAREVPPDLRQLCPFDPDYLDAFVAPAARASPTASAEPWARAAMEGAPAVGRLLAWRVLCHLRLRPEGTPGHITGWRIAEQGDGWIRVEAASWFMTATVVFQLAEGRIWFVTFIRYEHPAGRAIWTVVSAIHRAAARPLLAHGVRRAQRRPAALT